MSSKGLISSLVIGGVLAASVSTAVLADDHRGHDNGVAIAAGIIGGVVIGSLIANAQSAPQPQPYYQAPPQAYYSPQPAQQVYYSAPPQYYAPPAPVAYVNGRYYDRHDDWRYQHREHPGYYTR